MRAALAPADLADALGRPELVRHAHGVADEVAPDGTGQSLGKHHGE